ncbi:MAG: hypothetical protein IM657_13690, partial [Phenylobacterium sp.]|uniref:hypothetical protein n=1 Tax=Phenylobacterium sp. TaxID=1871053 RepID=UPI0025D628B3
GAASIDPVYATDQADEAGTRVPQGEALVLDDAAAMALVNAGAASIDPVYATDQADEAGTEPDATDQADEAGAEPDATPRRKKR